MSKRVPRRAFLAGAAAVAAAVTKTASKAHAHTGMPDYNPGGKPFMDQFYDGACEIVRGIRDTQIPAVTRAMKKAYEVKQNGGTIYSNVFYGHYSHYAGSRERPGQPWVLPHYAGTMKEEIASMNEGDLLLTDYVDENRKTARDRGVYVVGVTNNYMRFYKTPPEGMNPGRMKLAVEDVSNMVIDSQVPWDNGLVSTPRIPRFKLCPSSGISQYAVYWACTASLACLIGTKGKDPGAELVRHYLDLLLERYRFIGTDRPKIDRIAKKWADLVMYEDARLLVYGQQYAIDGSPSKNMFVWDAVGAASGSMLAQEYEGDVREHDIVLICSEKSGLQGDIDVARSARGRGAYTVAFCPYTAEGDASGTRLFREVDDALNTYCAENEGVLAVKGFDKKICPLTGLTGDLILWMLTAQWTDHMMRRGEIPYYWMNHDERGGREYDNGVRPYFLERGY